MIAVIHDFGDKQGMAVLDPATRPDQSLIDELVARGYGYTVLASGWDSFDRARFIDALNDWGWTGNGAPPDWYSGVPSYVDEALRKVWELGLEDWPDELEDELDEYLPDLIDAGFVVESGRTAMFTDAGLERAKALGLD